MKNQTPRLNTKTVNGNLQEITSFSRSRYEIQGRRQPASSGALMGTISSGGTGETRPEGPTGGVVGEGAASFPSTSYGVWGAL